MKEVLVSVKEWISPKINAEQKQVCLKVLCSFDQSDSSKAEVVVQRLSNIMPLI